MRAENTGNQFPASIFGTIEIAGDIKTRQALERYLLDGVVSFVDLAINIGLDRIQLGHGPQSLLTSNCSLRSLERCSMLQDRPGERKECGYPSRAVWLAQLHAAFELAACKREAAQCEGWKECDEVTSEHGVLQHVR